MPRDALSSINLRSTPQTEQARDDQVVNSAGGYAFEISPMARALRFLVLGTDGGTYYVSERDLTRDNAKVIIDLARTDGEALVALILEVSLAGRAPRQNPTLFALAACCASEDLATRKAACAAIPRVCRTGTHLFIFARYVEQFRGWGRTLRRAIGNWYLEPAVDELAYQAVKYRQREGWSHRDLLRLAHPLTTDPGRKALFGWIANKPERELPRLVEGFERAQRATHPKEWAGLVAEYRLPWEALPDAALSHAEVWEALLPHLGLTALIRQLPRLTNLGLIAPFSDTTREIVRRLHDEELIRKARVHPLALLVAQATYAAGRGFRSQQTWNPNPAAVEALNDAFYLAFGSIEPANKRTLLGLDISGSMFGGSVANSPLTPAAASGAMAMVTLRSEPETYTMGFTTEFQSLPLTRSQRLDDVLKVMHQVSMRMGRTDCALPMVWAEKNKVPVDLFVIYTDNETWAGHIHPFQALAMYRRNMGIPARLAVVGMTATGFSIADPKDPGMLDVVGFDTATPNLLTAFGRGEL